MKGVTITKKTGSMTIKIDMHTATHLGIPWKFLGAFGKRKFENGLYLENTCRVPINFVYV